MAAHLKQVLKKPSTEVQNNFGRCLDQVHQSARTIVVEKFGKPFGVLLNYNDWLEMQENKTSWLEACDEFVESIRCKRKKQTSAVELIRQIRSEE